MTHLNLLLRSKLISKSTDQESLKPYCDKCKLEFFPAANICKGFYTNLGYGAGDNKKLYSEHNSIETYLFGSIHIILFIVSNIFLGDSSGKYYFYMLNDFMQMFYIESTSSQKNQKEKKFLMTFKFTGFDFGLSWLPSIINKIQNSNYEILEGRVYENYTQNKLIIESEYLYHWENVMQTGKIGIFIFDAAPVLEFYIYSIIGYLLCKIMVLGLRTICGVKNLTSNFIGKIITNISNIRGFYRIMYESFIFIFFYSILTQFLTIKPLNNASGSTLISRSYFVTINRLMERIMLVFIGIGIPTYFICKLLFSFTKNTKTSLQLRYTISGTKSKSQFAQFLPLLLILRKVIFSFFIMFKNLLDYKQRAFIFILMIQIMIIVLVYNSRPYDSKTMNYIFLFTNIVFLFKILLMFYILIIENYLNLIYLTSNDFGEYSEGGHTDNIVYLREWIGYYPNLIVVYLFYGLFTLAIFFQVIVFLKENRNNFGVYFAPAQFDMEEMSVNQDEADQNMIGLESGFYMNELSEI